MTKRSLTSLVIKLLCVFLFMVEIPQILFPLFQVRLFFNNGSGLGDLFSFLSVCGFPFIFLALLYLAIRKSDSIAALVIREDEDEELVGPGFPLSQVQALIVAAIGIWILAKGLPQLLNLVTYWQYMRGQGMQVGPDAHGHQMSNLIQLVVQMALGGFFVARPWTVSSWLNRMQRYDRHGPPGPQADDGELAP